jgi:hypothetical protein
LKLNEELPNNRAASFFVMKTTYEISLNLKARAAIESYGCFSIGQDEQFARDLYSTLEGGEQVSLDSVITVDLIKRENGIPYPLDMRHCTYDQLAANVKLITKELFKRLNLEE